MEVKFAHIADTHLGAKNFKLKEREEDFYKAFEDAIEKIIKEKVDFVIHSGDLFDKASPSISSILVAIENLKKLKENNIPLFIVPGNHDIFLNETFLSVLESLGLLKNIGAKRYFVKRENFVTLLGENFKDVFICGVPGRRAHIKEMYRKIVPKVDGYFKIFVFHHTVSLVSRFFDIDTGLLPKGFDYYAGGHWHERFESEKIFYPGSIEYWNVDEMRKNSEKGFFIVRLSEDGIKTKFVQVKTRKIKKFEINCENLSIFELNSKILEALKRENGENSIGILRLYGRLKEGSKNRINRGFFEEFARERGFLYLYIDDNDLLNPSEPFISNVREKSLEEIEEEYLRKRFSEEEVELAKFLIEVLGKDYTPLEFSSIKRKVLEEIKKRFHLTM